MHYFIAHTTCNILFILRIICRESEIVISAFAQLSPNDDVFIYYNYLGYSKYLLFIFRIRIFTILKSFKNEQNGSTTVEEGRNFPPYFKQVSIFKIFHILGVCVSKRDVQTKGRDFRLILGLKVMKSL